ncbi:uncharacterized protein LOC110250287 [Exaiptasia diaphana]|uniref:Uncharacterized protein n=1 Tax=Exaiptasia diaphana TaxID=2652724 RepID=A0A913Y1E6_EXADI|nr:uncharacterized protein LOC110250287 [Exaiptasia diaphana]
MTHTELQQYHDLSDRKHIIKQVTSEAEYSDLSHGIVYAVNIIMDDGEKTKEHRRSTEKRAVIRRHSSSVLRSHSLLEDIQFARSVIMEENVDRQQKRKIVENRKLIQRRSSADIGRFSDDTLSYAVNVLSPSQHDKQRSKMASERRRVVREATSRERSGSFLDEVQFARSVVLPSHQIRELDEDAAFRRELVKESHCGAGRRMSFTDDVIAAQEIISPEWRVRAESFESDSRSLNEVEGKASGSWGSL